MKTDHRSLRTRCCTPPGAGLPAAQAAGLAVDAGVLAHPVRLQLLSVIAGAGAPVCVCDVESTVAVKQPTVSHHLRLLREAGLVRAEKRGLWVYYSADAGALARLRRRLDEMLGALAAAAGPETEAA